MCVQSLRLGALFLYSFASLFIFKPYIIYPFPLTEELTSEVSGPFIGSENASVGMMMVDSKEALVVSITISIAIQLKVTVLVVPKMVLLTTILIRSVNEGVTVILLIKVFHER